MSIPLTRLWPRSARVLVLAAIAAASTIGCGQVSHRLQSTARPAATACRPAQSSAQPQTECLKYLQHAVPVHSIRLSAEVSRRVLKTCDQAARATHIRVICPPVTPADGVTGDPSLYGPQIVSDGTYTMSFNNGQVTGHIHWEIGAATGSGVWRAEFDRSNWDAPLPKQPPRRISTRRHAGYVIKIYRFPDSDGQLEGHDVALATEHGITYFASIHGHNHDDADIAMLLAILLAAKR